MYKREQTGWTKHIDFMLLDIVILNIAFVVGYWIRFPKRALPYFSADYRELIIVVCLIEVTVSVMLNNLSDVLKRRWMTELSAVFALTFIMTAFTALYMFVMHIADIYSRLVLSYTMVGFLVMDFGARLILKRLVIRGNINSGKKPLIVVTREKYAEEIIRKITSDIQSGYNLVGIVLYDSEPSGKTDFGGIPVVSSIEDAPAYICREWIDEVLIYLPGSSGKRLQAFLDSCAEMGVTVHTALLLQNADRHKQFIESIGGQTVITTAFNYARPYQILIKRLMDIVGGIVGSILAVILALFIGPVIAVKSPGPILFRQTRIGQNGKPFTMYKFRSMYPDAEERKDALRSENRNEDGMMFKLDFDPRIIGNRILPDGTKKTGIGEFIRKTSLDEFPQFWNVLKGDMSLVGTRPPTVDEWNKYELHHRARMSIKPGITGLWQVSGRSEITDFEEVVRLDTKYICTWGIGNDIIILFRTLKVFLMGRGAL